jgi:beta-glucosidase
MINDLTYPDLGAPIELRLAKQFLRVTLEPGGTRTIRFELTPDDLAFWDINMNWVIEPGTFSISVGNSSASPATVRLSIRQTAEMRND